jgi:Methyltransferase domain
VPHRLQPVRRIHPLHKYFLWAVTETPFGKWRKEFVADPLAHLGGRVRWRNYEAGYDVAELEPLSRKQRTYVLQEYFVPVARFQEFVPRMAEILARHRVNAVNVSVRHAMPDPGSLLAWAREEVFAFVLYYKQRVRENAKERVAVWTRELIDAVLQSGGTYYLPYQAHATPEQFHCAYPRARELFVLKKRLDPEFRFRNVLWDAYYAPTLGPASSARSTQSGTAPSDFHSVYGETRSRDAFYRFLQNVYRLYPEDRFHTLIRAECARHETDEAIYRALQEGLPALKTLAADLTYALPSLAKQKREMGRQTLELVARDRSLEGYVEIGTTGRYVGTLRQNLRLSGPTWVVNDVAPGMGPVDVVERGGIRKAGRFVPLNDYAPISEGAVPDASADLVTCYIGLHHVPEANLPAFVGSIVRILRPKGCFVLRDHDVRDEPMRALVSLAHTVFNAGLVVDWQVNARELRRFAPLASWVRLLEAHGLRTDGRRLLQANDPTDNSLVLFVKEA